MKAVIVDWLRSPFHRAHKGKLANVRPDEMAGQVIRELMKRNNPVVIPRNHKIEEVLNAAQEHDLKPFLRFLEILKKR